MTIKYRRSFEAARPAGFDGEFDWDFLLPAFEGTKITPMDLDCVVEKNGKFLVFETKLKDAPISLGQQIMLERLVETKLFNVIILRGKRAEDIHSWDHWFEKSSRVEKKYYEGEAADLTAFVRRWFEWACKQW
jgi:hypothetical protein